MTDQQLLVLPGIQDFRTELVRKTIHFLIVLSIGMAAIDRSLTIAFLGAGVFMYTAFEVLRLFGVKVPVVSQLTVVVSRPRDEGHFVLGPITLGLGALLAFLIFSPAAASIAVCALAFGDGLASIAGKMFGRSRPAFMYGKSIEGSLACFMAVYFTTLQISGSPSVSLAAAVAATLTEALPLDDFDNIAIPLVTGMAVTMLM